MKSRLFYSDEYKAVEERIKQFINDHDDFLSESTARSTRAAGDAIQEILADNFQGILGDVCKKYSSDFARRAMADLAFEDRDGYYYVVDVKTHRLSTKFNMPNLTSVERLARFYEDDRNYFVVLMVSYDIEGTSVDVKDVHFIPIEFLGWDCLTIGALGWGQIQIANSNVITINDGYSRKKWMIELCDVMLEFYPKEIGKINTRIERFRKIKEYWAHKPD
jgi:hypothetical protein